MKYHYYIVENLYPARFDEDTEAGEELTRDGTWIPGDGWKIVTDGREVTEAEAHAFWPGTAAH